MKKWMGLLLICVLLLALAGCGEKLTYGEDSELYLAYVAGKSFEAGGGQQITFYPDGAATYDFRNGVGENHHYNYRVIMEEVTDTQITMRFVRLVVDSKNYHTEDAIDDEEKLAVYSYSDDSLEYYQHYDCVYNANTAEGEGFSDGFTNYFGTPTTLCAQDGCKRYIAPAGNTQFCTEHTTPCPGCGEYRDTGVTCYRCIEIQEAMEKDKGNPGGGKGDKGGCPVCNGSGYVKYNYGNSDLEAFLDGYAPYTVGKCTSCGGTGK